jgi:hypothetical protein
MYLVDLEAPEQISDPSPNLTCQVRLKGRYGNQRPNVMEFWWKGGSDSNWTLVLPRVTVADSGDAQEAVVEVPAGVPGMIIVCPRMLDDRRQLRYRQRDDNGEELIWNGFCLFRPFTGQRRDLDPHSRCQLAPTITKMETGYGTVDLEWTNPEGYDRFSVRFADSASGGNPRTVQTEDTHFRFDRVPAGGCFAQVAGQHDGNDWTGTAPCTSPWSGTKERSVEQGYTRPAFTPGTPVAAVKHNIKHRELFACMPDGRPVGIWQNDSPWQPWYSHGADADFMPATPLFGLSRDDGFMDLFGVSADGRVYLAWWHSNPWREWFPLSDRDFTPKANIAGICRNTDQMDIFIVGRDGVVRSAWWNGDPWREWFALPGAAFPAGAPIAAITRNPDQMDIFAVANDGVVRSNWWNGNPWRGWLDLGGATFTAGAHVAATSRNPDFMDVFGVGSDGIVRSNWWNGNPWRGWFDLGGATFPAGAPIAAQSLNPNVMVIAAVGADGKARVNRFNGQWSGWQELGGMTFPAGAPVALRDGVFAVAADGYLRGHELSPASGWYELK